MMIFGRVSADTIRGRLARYVRFSAISGAYWRSV